MPLACSQNEWSLSKLDFCHFYPRWLFGKCSIARLIELLSLESHYKLNIGMSYRVHINQILTCKCPELKGPGLWNLGFHINSVTPSLAEGSSTLMASWFPLPKMKLPDRVLTHTRGKGTGCSKIMLVHNFNTALQAFLCCSVQLLHCGTPVKATQPSSGHGKEWLGCVI